ncbi:MAG: hypothetical protein HOW73_32860 [Polyangiaceae bacterium]|nr:hypothetical protein [Polyangiaceae bacterium]
MEPQDELAHRGAQNLVNNHLRVREGECVVVFHRHADAVLPIIRAALEEAKARVECVSLAPWNAIVDDREFARLVAERVRNVQASMYLSSVDGPAYPRSRLLVDALNNTGVRHLQVPGVSARMLATSLRADPTLIEQVNQRLVERLEAGRLLTVTSPAGTDVTVALSRNFPVVGYCGIPMPGAWDSVPTGAVSFYSPNVSGTYVADRIARGSYLGGTNSQLHKTPLTLRLSSSMLQKSECEDAALVEELATHLAKDEQSGRVGFVSFSTNYLTKNELRVFANDALLPGLRLMLGYSDQTKTKAPHTAAVWATFLGRRQTVAIDGQVLVRDGRLDSKWTAGILPF